MKKAINNNKNTEQSNLWKAEESILADRLKNLESVFLNASIGNFQSKLDIPDTDDVVSQVYSGVQLLLDLLNEKIEELEKHNNSLEREIESHMDELMETQKVGQIGSSTWDLNRNVLHWNRELFDIFELDITKDLTISQTEVLHLVHDEDIARFNVALQKALETGKSFSTSYRIFTPKGQMKHLSCKGRVIFNTKREPQFLKTVIQDITSEINAQNELNKLSIVAEQTDNAVIIVDKFGIIEWVNEGYTKLTGYHKSDVLGKHANLTRGANPKNQIGFQQILKSLTLKKESISYEVENFTKNGDSYWVLSTLTPIFDSYGELEKIVSIDSNISRIKSTESSLKRALLHAEESEKAKHYFLANMTHEIRTPLNGIIGFSHLLKQTHLDAEQAGYLKLINQSSETLLSLVNQVLDLSKIESGEIEIEEVEFDIKGLLKDIYQRFEASLPNNNVRFLTNIDKSLPQHIKADKFKINQILTNLIGNALKFTKKGNVVLSAKISSSNILDISVEDSGIGIPKEKLSEIFESYKQGGQQIIRDFGGTGLGLTICKNLASLLNGNIFVESEVNKGSIFTFSFPFSPAENELQAAKTTPPEFAGKTDILTDLSLLLVEDNQINALLINSIMTKLNVKVDIAENGKIALQKLENKNYDFVLMDLMMPEMDGYTATIRIREELDDKKTPIIALTAKALHGEKEKCLALGMNGYLTKPFKLNELLDLLEVVLTPNN